MKMIKKILKFIAIIGALAGFAKLVCKLCKVTIKMNDYNKQVVFNGYEKNYDEEPFENDSVASLFSGVELNFDKSKLKNKMGVLNVFGRFSGIEITVPEHWQVQLDGVQKASGIENSTFIHDNDDAPILNINYDLKFCGLEVSNPKIAEVKIADEDFEVGEVEENIESLIDDELEDLALEDEIEEMVIEEYDEDL